MKNRTPLQSFYFTEDTPPTTQLLAFTLAVIRALKNNNRVHALIPKTAYQEIPKDIFEEIFYDTLAQQHEDLDAVLRLGVRPIAGVFEIFNYFLENDYETV
jgi:hypothetical protein